MPTQANIDNLFANHTFSEIEKLRYNLVIEVDKKTDQLKSIVKEKYKDIVEATDAIQEMKNILRRVENSLAHLDDSIHQYHEAIDGVGVELKKEHNEPTLSENKNNNSQDISDSEMGEIKSEILAKFDRQCKRLFDYPSIIWQNFDNGELKNSVALLEEANQLIQKLSIDTPDSRKSLLGMLEKNIKRTKEMLINRLCYIIQVAPTDQVGIIGEDGGKDNEELHQLCLNGSIEMLTKEFKKKVLDLSLTSLAKKSQTFTIVKLEPESDRVNEQPSNDQETANMVTIPNNISLELHTFLFEVCQNINKIAGFNLSRSSMISTLEASIEKVCQIYNEIHDGISRLPPCLRRKRSLQLYFDLLFVRSLISSSKNFDLEENLVPKVIDIVNKYETMLDSIELYTISDVMQTSLAKACRRSIKLFGLLIPYH